MKFRFPWSRPEEDRALDEKIEFIDAKTREVEQQTPAVNALVAWLEARKMTNGFGDDFEWTLSNPRR